MTVRWVGKKTLSGGRLEVGRFWFTYCGFGRPKAYNIGKTRVYKIPPVTVFIGEKESK